MANELCARNNKIEISWFLSKGSYCFFEENASKKLINISDLNFFHNDEAISLKSIYNNDFEQKYMKWNDYLNTIINSKSFDLVISDNLCAPLQFNSNCIILGSFLWHDVAERTHANSNILDFERDLFRKFHPIVYGMQNFSMPEIRKYGKLVEVPSLIESVKTKKPKSDSNYKIFITAGKSGDLLHKYKKIKNKIVECAVADVYFDLILNDKGSRGTVFDYTDNSFSQLSVIIARPGIGIISDAIKFRIPIIVDTFYKNKELEFNASKIEELGIGKRLNFDNYDKLSERILNLLNDKNFIYSMINNLKKINTGGASVMANNILTYL